MTNKTEDKFYFGKSGQPERFAISSSDLNYAKSQIRSATPERLREIEQELLPFANGGQKWALVLLAYLKSEWNERYRMTHSRPGQPERFAREVIARKGNKRVELSGPNGNGNWVVTVMEENKQVVPGEVNERFVDSKFYSTEAGARRAAAKMLASRPGQPERFGLEDACWQGYEPVGTKQKDGRTVPNCVPKAKNNQPQEFAAKKQSAISVTDAEYAALVAADAEMEQWLKYQYQPTQQQKAIRDAGKAAMASALARLNATHKKWEAASSDAERAQIEKQYAASGRSYKSKHFSRPGSPERFAESLQAKWDGKQYRVLTPSGAAWYSDDGKRWTLKHGEPVLSSEVRKYDIKLGTGFSRPGQPERFAEGGAPIGPSMLQKINSALASGQTVYVSTMTKITKITPKTWKKWEASGRPLFKLDSKGALMMASGSSYNTLSMGPTLLVGITMRNESSRPGQPDKFDASSLNRGNFAEASSSPMLGKLLSEKQMPEGGWRAVETGGGALVISFEDADVAGNFARRVAGSGYSATAPVQAIGRYWNVEVKNG